MQTPSPCPKAQHRAATSCGAAARPGCSALPVVCVWSAVLLKVPGQRRMGAGLSWT